MKVLFLGSGASTGVPVIGCKCDTCTSDNPKDKRTRASILITSNGKNILIDTSTDLRFQALTYGIERVDAVLFTHAHADHVHGIDDMRGFNHSNKGPIPCYGDKHTVEVIRKRFSYIFNAKDENNWIPHLTINPLNGPCEMFGLRIVPIHVMHGERPIYGYRINNMAYLTDCNGIPPSSMDLLKDLSLLILDATLYKPHKKHFGFFQALEVIEQLRPEKAILTHLSHMLKYDKASKELPAYIGLAYDGLKISL